MEVQLLNGGTARIRLSNKKRRSKEKCKSLFQYRIGQQLAEEYPHDIIFEEVIIPVERFIIDFFIPSVNLVIECNGKQHTEHIKHFHKTIIEFHKQQDVDQKKRDWCLLNGYRLVEIYDE